ncbi:O-antigen ligase family protein [Parendozoicomonas sp. Alg238-R29]|uniref:O-antigen ligase family protein n=1 Tax=Parendozoicomonas sp. Alg238-R29 TaxID=2993446 RepID=UPI00248E4339|nr:O-antigen ligase family protein [Parendozoicomonas sp. Alg238-R29]
MNMIFFSAGYFYELILISSLALKIVVDNSRLKLTSLLMIFFGFIFVLVTYLFFGKVLGFKILSLFAVVLLSIHSIDFFVKLSLALIVCMVAVYIAQHGYSNKLSFIPFFTIYLCLLHCGADRNNHKKLMAFGIVLFIVDIVQVFHFQYRSEFLKLFTVSVFFMVSERMRYKLYLGLISLPFIYIACLMFFLYAQNSGMVDFPSVSNLERSLMVKWMFENIAEYVFHGGGVEIFQESVSYSKMALNIGYSVPNDPHNLFVLMFIEYGLIGLLMSVLFYLFIFLKKEIRHAFSGNDLVCFSIISVVYLVSMNPFDYKTRLVVSVLMGLVFNVILRRRGVPCYQ